MRISVVMPAYNAEKFIGAALDSVADQSLVPLETIVVDDGSTDRTAELAGSHRLADLIVVQQQNKGPAAARNAALTGARGDWIAFLDADDLWMPGKLALQAHLADHRPEVDIWLGATEGVAIDHLPQKPGAFMASFASRLFLQLGATLVRRAIFERVGLFDPQLAYGEDLDWIMRAQEMGAIIQTHSDTVLQYQRHGENMTNHTDLRDRDFMRTLKKSIDRGRLRRQAQS